MWPTTVPALQAASVTLLWIGAIAGAISVFAGATSAILANRASSVVNSEANVRISSADAVAQQARLDAARVEQQNIELRAKFANRRITVEQHDEIVRELATAPVAFDIETMSDSESGLYAADILKTLSDSGWHVDQKTFPLGVVWTGLNVFLTDDPAAVRLVKAFQKAGIPVQIGNEHRTKVTIMVGGRPPIF